LSIPSRIGQTYIFIENFSFNPYAFHSILSLSIITSQHQVPIVVH
jgi:hypothetical protein